MPYIESEAEFIARHGGKPIRLNRGVRLLADGAKITDTEFDTFFTEPPAHPERRLEARKLYWETLRQRAETAFRNCQARIAGGMDESGNPYRVVWDETFYGPVPAAHDGAAWLLRLKAVVHQFRAAVADIARLHEALPAVRERREREEWSRAMEDETRRKAEAERDAALAVKLD